MILLAIGLTLLVITLILVGLFYVMYHTFHGDLPNTMIIVIVIFGLVSILLTVGGLIYLCL